jgi:hypothetical protein
MPEPRKQLPVHPLIASLAPEGQSAVPSVKLSGYLGPPSQAGKARLYSTLDDLSHYLEFDQDAVVQTGEAAESELPNNGHYVWVKASAPVRWIHEYPSASSFAADIAANLQRFTGWRQ